MKQPEGMLFLQCVLQFNLSVNPEPNLFLWKQKKILKFSRCDLYCIFKACNWKESWKPFYFRYQSCHITTLYNIPLKCLKERTLPYGLCQGLLKQYLMRGCWGGGRQKDQSKVKVIIFNSLTNGKMWHQISWFFMFCLSVVIFYS